MKKRCLSALLALCMVVALLPGTAWAANTGLVIENAVLVKYNGPGGNVVIPEGVIAIGDEAFAWCEGLTGVTIPGSVSDIGNSAFAWCENLTSVTIPYGVHSIGSGAFSGTGLTSVAIPSSVTFIDDGTFDFCWALTSVSIPVSVTEIGRWAFDNCDSLTDVYYGGGADKWQRVYISPKNDVLYNAKVHYNSAMSYSGTWKSNITWSFSGGTLNIQGTGAIANFGTYGAVDIPWDFYYGETIRNVTIGSGVTSIGNYSFYLIDTLTSVTIPASVVDIGIDVFYGCDNLTDIYYGGSESQWKQININNYDGGNDQLFKAAVHYSGPSAPAVPSTPAAPGAAASGTVVLSPQKLTVDGRNVDCEKYNIGGSNYFKLRDLAYLLNGTGSQFGVGFDAATSTVSITTGTAYTPIGTELVTGVNNSSTARPTSQAILINGVKRGDLTVYNIGGSNFFQLRELGNALGFEVGYDAVSNTAIVRSTRR